MTVALPLPALWTEAAPSLRAVAGCPPQAANLVVRDVVSDSRLVTPGALFVAVPTATQPAGHAADAVARGAVAVVGLPGAAPASLPVPWLEVSSPRRAVGLLAAVMHRHPSQGLLLLAVTGTNGKSTTAVLVAQLLTAAGIRAAALGTLGLWTPAGVEPGGLTTPDGADLQRRLATLRDAGFAAVAIEASSHALDQDRLAGARIHAAAWTNLTVDHLDYHGTMDGYAAAKRRLFEEFDIPRARAFANADDRYAEAVVTRGLATGFSFAGAPRAAVQASGLRTTRDGIAFQLSLPGEAPLAIQAPLLGRHNAENLTCAALLAAAAGVPAAGVAAAVATLRAPPGRLEPVANDMGALALVDYAHTPDALAHVLQVARAASVAAGRVVVVFGCGGDRDRSKRAQMGAVAAGQADVTIVTSDNPRSEDPQTIVDAVVAGACGAGARLVTQLVPTALADPGPVVVADADRASAIRRGVAVLRQGDVILVAGKGHEATQTIGADVRPFDDVAVLRQWLSQRPGQPKISHASRAPSAPARRAEPRWSGAELAAICGGSAYGAIDAVAAGVSTDSRDALAGRVFLALRGERFDGHTYAAAALQAGSVGVVVERGHGAALRALADTCGAFVIEVAHTWAALGAVGREHRRAIAPSVIGVTGSNGKTSTKELLALALAPFGRTLATLANHNNQIGVPQTLLRLRAGDLYAVVEMGMNEPGEIAILAEIAEPTLGVITSLGEAHLERLGSLHAIALEKASLLRALPAAGVAIVPSGVAVLEPLLRDLPCRLVRFGSSDGDEVRLVGAVHDGSDGEGRPWQRFDAEVFGRRVAVTLPAIGRHMVSNALAALAVAGLLGDNLEAAARQLGRYQPVGQRMRPSRLGGRLLLEDCYNANPTSVEAALATLKACTGPRVAVLGEMRELGDGAAALHERVAAAAAPVGALLALGPYAEAMAAAATAAGGVAHAFCGETEDPGLCDEVARAALAIAGGQGTVLVKASRGARLERVVSAMQAAARAAGEA